MVQRWPSCHECVGSIGQERAVQSPGARLMKKHLIAIAVLSPLAAAGPALAQQEYPAKVAVTLSSGKRASSCRGRRARRPQAARQVRHRAQGRLRQARSWASRTAGQRGCRRRLKANPAGTFRDQDHAGWYVLGPERQRLRLAGQTPRQHAFLNRYKMQWDKGTVERVETIFLSDRKEGPFRIVHEGTPQRYLTGADFDTEGFPMDR